MAMPAPKSETVPKMAAAPFSAMVRDVMFCVDVISTVVPSGTPVFKGSVIVPDASAPAGCNSIHCCSLTGVGTVMLKPVPGVYRLVATVGEAKVC